MSGPDDRPVLRVKQLAERLGVSERTARYMVAEGGELRSYRVRGARVVDAIEVDRYLEAQRAASHARTNSPVDPSVAMPR